jgi:hypothetical protein
MITKSILLINITLSLWATSAHAEDTAEAVIATAKQRTSPAALNPPVKCGSKSNSGDILVCGRRETAKYRYGQRGLPYSNKFKGFSPTEVAYALAGIKLPTFNTADWAVARQEIVTRIVPIGTTTGGLGAILDPLSLGYGTTRKSSEIFWAQQDAGAED